MTFPDPRADDQPAEPWSASDHETVTTVLERWAGEGIPASFTPGGEVGALHCDACGSDQPAARFEVIEERRLEGASDPDDMVLAVAARCPVCEREGSVVLGFGAEASVDDAEVVVALARPPTDSP